MSCPQGKPRTFAGLSWAVVCAVVLLNLEIDVVEGLEADPYVWTPSPWGECERGGGECNRARRAVCLRSVDSRMVPPYYCREQDDSELPVLSEPCYNCTQDCVHSVWSPWSECSATCAPEATRYRTRRVLVPARGEGARPCGPFSEVEDCPDLPVCTVEITVRSYTWKVGPWTSCRQIPLSARPKQSSVGSCDSGLRTREVACIDYEGNAVSDPFCMEGRKGASRPASSEACVLPCDCQVSDWGRWGACSKTCHDTDSTDDQDMGLQTRTRTVVRLPLNGGLPCPSLSEQAHCNVSALPPCPVYSWHSESWGECVLDEETEGVCGAGWQGRQVWCTEEADQDNRPVNNALCLHGDNTTSARPAVRRACRVPCPQDCELGEWQNWSPCTKSCGTGGLRLRFREVLIPAAHGGEQCDAQVQTRECEPVECSWWHTGRWSKCFLDFGLDQPCGPGSQIRVMYCKSALDEVLPRENCSHIQEPQRENNCKVPCPGDCVVSEWSDWGHCSVSCGVKGGFQTRIRQVLAYSRNDTECLPADELVQRRVCNQQVPCSTYLWQVGPWGGCQSVNQTCGDDSGVQTRPVYCGKDTGSAVDEELCDADSKPPRQQACSVPCPEDCMLSKFSGWSECSQTCGDTALKFKTQRILRVAANGGKVCPPHSKDGIVTKRRRCKNLPPCYTYDWSPEPWGECQALFGKCGPGYQTRKVDCGRNDGVTADHGVCVEKLLANPPPSQKRCFIPCPGDCVLSDWSDYGPCSQTCGDLPGTMVRTRYIVNLDPTQTEKEQCPHIRDEDLVEQAPCNGQPCLTYNWEMGPWRSCIPHKDAMCGRGLQHAVVLCVRSDGQQVEPDLCEERLRPLSSRPCDVPCPVDCQVSKWSEWSLCSHVCGLGTKNRAREVVRPAQHGGRPCPDLLQTTTCSLRSCEDLEWEVSEWSACAVRGTCGEGYQTRSYHCPLGEGYFEVTQCEWSAPIPQTVRMCDLPCPGDCVLSEWSDWSECSLPCSEGGGYKTRTREMVRRPIPEGRQCGNTTEIASCKADCQHEYRVQVSSWTGCMVPSGDVCGKGTRHRTVNCVRDDGMLMSLSHCHDTNVTRSEPCELECPVDCNLGGFSDWRTCTGACGLTAYRNRTREIAEEGNELGRPCPSELLRTQTLPCDPEPCYTHSWERGDWGDCSVASQGCGIGERTRTVKCHRSDGRMVDEIYCLVEDDISSLDPSQVQLVLSGVNRTELDIETSQSCGSPCPGDCQMTNWSKWGPCQRDCSEPSSRATRARTRAIIRPETGLGRACPLEAEELIQIRSCPSLKAVCPVYRWRTGPWDDQDIRDVWCEDQDGTWVTETACVERDRPSAIKWCIPECSGRYSTCSEGRCICQDGFEGDGVLCFPKEGCADDSHCQFDGAYCNQDDRRCECVAGMVALTVTGPCVLTTAAPTTTVTMPPTEGVHAAGRSSGLPPWWWIPLAVLVGVLAALLLGIMCYRKHHSGEAVINDPASPDYSKNEEKRRQLYVSMLPGNKASAKKV
ncbi:thrombospondin type-1 domain-containing protein 7A-like [Branchiostoma floridae x Branchiostoma japonicum]